MALSLIEAVQNPIALKANTDCLMALVEEAFIKANLPTRFKNVCEIIASDDNSAEFIREVLQDKEYRSADQSSPTYEFSKSRAQHSVLTFFVGLIFMEFGDFRQKIGDAVFNSGKSENVIRLWMLTALYHDWGYYSEDVKKEDLDFRKIIKYNLLTDDYGDVEWLHPLKNFSIAHPHILAYTYDEIMAYDQYSRLYHKCSDDTERVDHGILGGIKIFDRLVREISKDATSIREERLLFAKIACLTIAQHNIFKSNSKNSDLKYGDALRKLHSNSEFRISMDTPLLLLLSLVDTFECIKRFGQAQNERNYLKKKTILESIEVSVSSTRIKINYSLLEKRIQDKDQELKDCFSKYFTRLFEIDSWTTFSTHKELEKTISIQMAM